MKCLLKGVSVSSKVTSIVNTDRKSSIEAPQGADAVAETLGEVEVAAETEALTEN